LPSPVLALAPSTLLESVELSPESKHRKSSLDKVPVDG
jgi:hypothetical protein